MTWVATAWSSNAPIRRWTLPAESRFQTITWEASDPNNDELAYSLYFRAGTHVNGARPDALTRAGVSSIPEGRGIFPNLTVEENLRMWTYAAGLSTGDVQDRAFTRFPRLKERRRQRAGTMSGGEQQMLAMSRALVSDPAVLLLDEISMGLAPIIVAELYDLVRQLGEEGITILLVEQFANTALAVADFAAVMTHGRIVAVGQPQDIEEHVSAAYLGGAA